MHLVVVGDSFIYGQLGQDYELNQCWARSWVSKLGIIGKFKSVTNLGSPGGSNQRSTRVLLNWLTEHYNSLEEYLIIYAVTELSRFEVAVEDTKLIYDLNFIPYCPYEKHQNIANIGSWSMDCSVEPTNDYLKAHYGIFRRDDYDKKKLAHDILLMTMFFKNLKIKHYFMETICNVGDSWPSAETIPQNFYDSLGIVPQFIKFTNAQLYSNQEFFLKENGFKPALCSHFDHDANDFLANYIHKRISND
jgi:hypothetical protein